MGTDFDLLLNDLFTESDLCKNEGAGDIADLLDRAIKGINELNAYAANLKRELAWATRVRVEPQGEPDGY